MKMLQILKKYLAPPVGSKQYVITFFVSLLFFASVLAALVLYFHYFVEPSQNRASGMEHEKFWELIDAARNGREEVDEETRETLVHLLAKLEIEQLIEFQEIYYRLWMEANIQELADVIGAINGGAGGGIGDDGFSDFRDFLVMQGRETYEQIIADPELLLDHLDGDPDDEQFPFRELHFSQAANDAFRIKKNQPHNVDIELPLDLEITHEPTGPFVDTSDELAVKARFPRLWKYLKDRNDWEFEKLYEQNPKPKKPGGRFYEAIKKAMDDMDKKGNVNRN